MKKTILLCLLTAAALTVNSQITPSITIPKPIPEYNGTYEDFGQHHLFYPNGGEIVYAAKNLNEKPAVADEALFYTKFTYPRQYLLKNNSIAFVFAKRDTSANVPDSLQRIDLAMERANSTAFMARVDTQNTAVLNYFTQHFGAAGRTNVKGSAAIAVQSIYPNIDMVYTSNNTGLKLYYIVYPGGNPNQIMLKLNGAKSTTITNNELTINANWSNIKFGEPQMYQYTLLNNVVTPYIVCAPVWQNAGTNLFKFGNICNYDPNLPLIVQISQGPATMPNIANINWSTYFGGGLDDLIYTSQSDAANNLYVGGQTLSYNFPQAPNVTQVVQNTKLSGNDGFLAKFKPNGQLLWRTFVGGSSSDKITDFDFENGGDIYCVGFTSSFSNLPLTTKAGAHNDNTFNGGFGDGFIFQISPSGQTSNWLTYFGGNGDDELRGCKFDANNNFFVVGGSTSSNIGLVGSGGQYQQNFGGSASSYDAIIFKFTASNNALNWFSYYGTSGSDEFYGLDIAGTTLYACGYAGGGLPGSINSKFLTSYYDGMLASFGTNGAHIISKYTNGNTINNAVKVFNNKVYTCGQGVNGMVAVNSGSYYYDGTCAANDFDAVFSVHPLNLVTTTHASFLGGSAADAALDLVFAPNGVFYISGGTRSNDFPTTSIANTYNSAYVGFDDYFLTGMGYLFG
jgi:hypothetical protein